MVGMGTIWGLGQTVGPASKVASVIHHHAVHALCMPLAHCTWAGAARAVSHGGSDGTGLLLGVRL